MKYASQISSETNCLLRRGSLQQNEKHPNEDQQRLPQTLGLLGDTVIANIHIAMSYLNVKIRRNRRKFHLKTLVK